MNRMEDRRGFARRSEEGRRIFDRIYRINRMKNENGEEEVL
jgi:hypothetical protein